MTQRGVRGKIAVRGEGMPSPYNGVCVTDKSKFVILTLLFFILRNGGKYDMIAPR